MAVQLFENPILGGPTIHELMLAVFDRFPSNCSKHIGMIPPIERWVNFLIHDVRKPEGETGPVKCSVRGAIPTGRTYTEWLLTGAIEAGGPITGLGYHPYIAKFDTATGKGMLTVNPNGKGSAVIYIKDRGGTRARFDLGIRKA